MKATIAEKEINARITTRVPENVHNLPSEAASLVGSTLNQFIVQSALEKATGLLSMSVLFILLIRLQENLSMLWIIRPRLMTNLKRLFAPIRKNSNASDTAP